MSSAENTNGNNRVEWCPEADSNHRHADFQSNVDDGKTAACAEKRVKPPVEDQSLSSTLSNPDGRDSADTNSSISPAFGGMGEIDLRTRLSLISETRQLFGLKAARLLWSELGLPRPPDNGHPRINAVISFLQLTTEAHQMSEISLKELYGRYLIWTADSGSVIVSHIAFGKYLMRSGLVSVRKSSGSTYYCGIRWKAPPQ